MKFEQLSQRDPRWKNIKLGYGSGTIGMYGCTLTDLAMFAGITPDRLNTMLKGTSFRDSAFAGSSKNLINWTKLEKYTNGLIKFHHHGYGYNKDKITNAVSKYGACLVEVDFDGTGPKTNKHWILYKGNKKANDPWTGNEIPTSKYPIWTGWAEIEVNRKENMPDCPNMYKGLDLCNQASMKIAVDVWDDVINKKLYVKEAECQDRVEKAASTLQDRIIQLENDVRKANTEVKTYKEKLAKCQNDLENCSEQPSNDKLWDNLKKTANGAKMSWESSGKKYEVNYTVNQSKQ